MTQVDGRKRIQITLGEKTLQNLESYCERSGMSRSSYIEYVIASSLDTATEMKRNIEAAMTQVVRSEIQE